MWFCVENWLFFLGCCVVKFNDVFKFIINDNKIVYFEFIRMFFFFFGSWGVFVIFNLGLGVLVILYVYLMRVVVFVYL